MGTILSSTKNYNRALAKQPRKSIGLSKFDVPNIQQQPLIGTLSIPYPVRNSQLNDRIPESFNEPPRPELEPIFQEPIQPQNLSPPIDSQIPQQQSAPEKQSTTMYNRTMNNDAFVVRRSIVNLNIHQRLNNKQLALSSQSRSIVERNGKQFLAELKERMERRYVEVFDEYTGQMRLFEVTDYIPSRSVRSIKKSPQFQSQNMFSTRPPVDQRHAFQNTPNGRSEPATPSNLRDFRGLSNRATVAREFDLYHSGASLPYNNNNNALPITSFQPQTTAQDSRNSSYSQYERSQPKAYNSSTIPSQNAYNSSTIPSQNAYNPYSSESYQSQTRSFRPHSPSASDYSINASTARSNNSDSDRESINRVLTPTYHRTGQNRDRTGISYGTVGGQNFDTEPDLFAKPVRTGDHTYTKRPGFNNYSQPVTNNRGRGVTGISDYAPLPLSHNQSNQNYSAESDAYDAYDG